MLTRTYVLTPLVRDHYRHRRTHQYANETSAYATSDRVVHSRNFVVGWVRGVADNMFVHNDPYRSTPKPPTTTTTRKMNGSLASLPGTHACGAHHVFQAAGRNASSIRLRMNYPCLRQLRSTFVGDRITAFPSTVRNTAARAAHLHRIIMRPPWALPRLFEKSVGTTYPAAGPSWLLAESNRNATKNIP